MITLDNVFRLGFASSVVRFFGFVIGHESERRIIFIPKAEAGAREQPITARLATFLREWVEAIADESPWCAV